MELGRQKELASRKAIDRTYQGELELKHSRYVMHILYKAEQRLLNELNVVDKESLSNSQE